LGKNFFHPFWANYFIHFSRGLLPLLYTNGLSGLTQVISKGYAMIDLLRKRRSIRVYEDRRSKGEIAVQENQNE